MTHCSPAGKSFTGYRPPLRKNIGKTKKFITPAKFSSESIREARSSPTPVMATAVSRM